MRVISETLPDSCSRDFNVVTYAAEQAATADGRHSDGAETLVIANGYLEDSQTHQAVAAGMAGLAEAEGLPLRVTVHDSPLTGKSAYGLPYRTERFAKVVAHATHNGDLPVRLAGHSWGLPQVVAVGGALLDERRPVESVVGHNPNGLTPIELNARTIAGMVLAGVRESRLQAAALMRLGANGQEPGAGLGARARKHILHNLPAAYTEGRGLLTQSFVDETVGLHGRLAADGISRMTLFAGRQDGICPSSPMRCNLEQAGYPMTDFVELDTFHGGPLIEPAYTPMLYGAVMLRRQMAEL